MRETDLEALHCLECHGDLRVGETCREENGNIVDGALVCTGCGRGYPILNHVLLAFRKDVFASYLSLGERTRISDLGLAWTLADVGTTHQREQAQVEAAENWEYQWDSVMPYGKGRMAEEDGLYSAAAMNAFIRIPAEQVAGRRVFVGCGGRGREAHHMGRMGASQVVVNEIGREIYNVASVTNLPPERMLLIRGDIRHLPLKDGVVDIALCDHALQHVIDHRSGFASMVRITRPGGQVALCVYSYENNFIMTHLVDPSKHVLHILPPPALRQLSLLPTVLCYLLIRLLYVPFDRMRLVRLLPLQKHMMFWATFSFQDLWCSIFDLIHAPISYHFKRQELMDMVRENSLSLTILENTNQTLWSLVAERK